MSNTLEQRQKDWETNFNSEFDKKENGYKEILDDLINNGEDEFVREIGSFIKEEFGNSFGYYGTELFFGIDTFLKIVELHRGNIKEVK